jgi:hypothetical protein
MAEQTLQDGVVVRPTSGRKNRWWSVGLAGVAAVMALAAGGWLLQIPTLQVVRLPNGRTIRLVATTYGTEHRCVDGPRWQHLLLPMVGVRGAKTLGWRAEEFVDPKPAFVFWIASNDPYIPGWGGSIKRVGNENGSSVPWSSVSGNADGGPSPAPFIVKQFPRRGRHIYLDYFVPGRTPADWERGGRLVASNPTPGPFPQWIPQPLPHSVKIGDSTFVLQKFLTGVKGKKGLPVVEDPENGGTALEFQVLGSEQPRLGWRPVMADLTNAAGDSFESSIGSFGNALPNGLFAPWSVGTEEAAWKIGVHFTRTTGFTPAETWSLNNIRLPSPSQTETDLKHAVRRGAERVELSSLRVSRASEKRWEVHSRLEFSLPSAGTFVSLIGLTDERGRNLLHFSENPRHIKVSRPAPIRGYYPLVIEVPAGTRQINLKLALHRSQYVTFLAVPTTR